MAVKKTEEEIQKENQKEFENQLVNYYTLGITKSKKGQATLFVLGSVLITFTFAYFNVVNFDDIILGAFAYLIFALFIYKGHRWAMIGAMIMWTADKVYQISTMNVTSPISIFFWWIALMIPLYNAVKIENERIKRNIKNIEILPTEPAKESIAEEISEKIFCQHCGKEIAGIPNFCKFCGNKLD